MRSEIQKRNEKKQKKCLEKKSKAKQGSSLPKITNLTNTVQQHKINII
jgi:hypothetical protein